VRRGCFGHYEKPKKPRSALFFASERLKDNETIVLEAVKNNREAFNYASERLK